MEQILKETYVNDAEEYIPRTFIGIDGKTHKYRDNVIKFEKEIVIYDGEEYVSGTYKGTDGKIHKNSDDIIHPLVGNIEDCELIGNNGIFDDNEIILYYETNNHSFGFACVFMVNKIHQWKMQFALNGDLMQVINGHVDEANIKKISVLYEKWVNLQSEYDNTLTNGQFVRQEWNLCYAISTARNYTITYLQDLKQLLKIDGKTPILIEDTNGDLYDFDTIVKTDVDEKPVKIILRIKENG